MTLNKTSNVFFGLASGLAILLPIAHMAVPAITRLQYMTGVGMVATFVATAIGLRIASDVKCHRK